MSVIRTIRNHSGLFGGVLIGGLALFFIIGSDAFRLASMFSGQKRSCVGTVYKSKIDIREYQEKLETLRRMLGARSTAQEQMVREYSWNSIIEQRIYQDLYNKLGIEVCADELVDLVQGDNPHPEIKAAFTDPKTNNFDKNKLISYLQNLPTMPKENQIRWHNFELAISDSRKYEKLRFLLQKSSFVTDLELQDKYNKANISRIVRYVYIPYYTLQDDSVKVIPSQLKEYLTIHKNSYQVQESRGLKYFVFPIVPTNDDIENMVDAMYVLKRDFYKATNDYSFAESNTDSDVSSTRVSLTGSDLKSLFDKNNDSFTDGIVLGPIRNGKLFKLYKIVSTPTTDNAKYELAVVEKILVPGDKAKNIAFKQANTCALAIKDQKDWDKYAEKEGLKTHNNKIQKNDYSIGNVRDARKVVHWLYNSATVGKISTVFDLDSCYIVACMTNKIPQGIATLDQVKDKVTDKIVNQQKAKIILNKVYAINASSLEELANEYGSEARYKSSHKVKFEDNTLPDAGIVKKTIGAIFALHPGKRLVVEDDSGITILELIDEEKADPPLDIDQFRNKLIKLQKETNIYAINQTLHELAKVQDYRYKFY